MGKVDNVGVAINSMLIPTTFHIIESVDKILLLGMDWLEETQANLNFAINKLSLHYRQETVEVPILRNN